jgi:hypothetical protein
MPYKPKGWCVLLHITTAHFQRLCFWQSYINYTVHSTVYKWMLHLTNSNYNIWFNIIWGSLRSNILHIILWHVRKSIARQRPQHTRGQQYCSNVFFVSAVSHTTVGRGHVTRFLWVQPARQWTCWIANTWHVFCDACPRCIYISEQNA